MALIDEMVGIRQEAQIICDPHNIQVTNVEVSKVNHRNDRHDSARSPAREQERLGALLREAREYLGLSQELVAEKLGIPRASVSAIETGKRFTAAGKPVRYIRSTFVPQESHCMCLFEASNPELVKQLNDEAKIPYSRVVEAADLTP